MRLESITVHEMGPFRDFAVDLSALGDALLVAITGANGSGKSTLLELALPGALYRDCPTRGSLQSLATARDSYVESRVSTGEGTFTLRHVVDRVSGKGESLVLDEAGAPILPTTSVKAFDAWAARHLPPPAVLYSSVFAPQGAGGFLAAKPGDRKAILLRILGVEHLEQLAARARERERAAKAEAATARARLEDERARAGDPAEIEHEVAAVQEAALGAEDALGVARAALEAGRAAEQAHALAAQEAAAVRQRRAELGTRRAVKAAELADVEAKLRNNRAVLDEADAIRAAKARADELAIEVGRLGEELRSAEERRLAAVRERDQHVAAHRAARARVDAARGRAAAARQRLEERRRVEEAVQSVPRLEAALTEAQEVLRAAEADLEQVRGARLAGAGERIEHLREALAGIALDASSAMDDADRALREDDAALALAAELPARTKAALDELHAARDREAMAARRLAEARALAARRDTLDAAEREAAQSDQDAVEAEADATAEASAVQMGDRAITQNEAARAAAQERRSTLQREQTDIGPLAAKAAPLANAEARIAELEPRAEALRAEMAGIDTDLAGTSDPAPCPPRPDVAGLLSRVDIAEQAARSAAAAVALAEQRLEAARASQGRIEQLQGELGAHETAVADWARLASELGRDGLQAAEIDCAGPELTELVNDLLRTCVGPRWTLSIETTKASADGKRTLEGCEVRVVDTERGRDAEAATFSGGERVILGEAVSLALTMLACRRSGLRGVTLVRDESGAALDPANARAYVAMLRRAAELVGASRVLFVSHSPEVVDLADARIDVGAEQTSAREAAE